MVAAVLTGLLLLQLFGERIGGLAWAPVVVAYPMIPIAIGVAVLRYRLFEIDRLVSRTISYAAVTGLLGSLFVILILGLQELLEPFTQRQSVAVAASTLAVAALFQPVLRRVRRAVDHRFDRARYDGEQTATAFSERLRAETDLATVTADLSATARAALAPTSLDVWLRPRRRPMIRRVALPFAIVGWVAAVAGAVGAIALRIVDPVPQLPSTFGFGDAALVGFGVLGVAFVSVGAVLVVRRPHNIIGWLMVMIGDGYAVGAFWAAVTFSLAAHPATTPVGWLDVRIAGWLTVLFTSLGAAVFALGFVFPTGRGQTPAWDKALKVAAALIPFMLVSVFLIRPGPLHVFPTVDNPFGFGPDLRPWLGDKVSERISAMAVVMLPLLVWSVASRYRSAGQVERQQLKWFALAIGVTIACLAVAGFSASLVADPPEIGLALFGFVGALVPVAIGIAILRYHLYDLDRIVSRTVAYGIVIGVLGVVFVAIVLGAAGPAREHHLGPGRSGRRVHPRRPDPVPARLPAGQAGGRPALRPGSIRRGADRRGIRGPAARRDQPGRGDLGPHQDDEGLACPDGTRDLAAPMMQKLARPFAIVGSLAAILAVVGTIVVRVVAPAPFIQTSFGFGPAVMVAFVVMGVMTLVLLLGGALTSVTRGVIPVAQGETIAVVASTLVVFLLFQPVRRRVQRSVDRRFDRARFDAEVVVRAFASRLRDDVDLAAVSREVADTATNVVRPRSVSIWLRGARR